MLALSSQKSCSKTMYEREDSPREESDHEQTRDDVGDDAEPKEERAEETAEVDSPRYAIFVKGVTHGIRDEEVRELFGQFGQIIDIRIPSGKTFLFVDFGSEEAQEKAISELDGKTVSGDVIHVEKSRDNGPRSSRWRSDSEYERDRGSRSRERYSRRYDDRRYDERRHSRHSSRYRDYYDYDYDYRRERRHRRYD